jgi:hypothetical protein
MFSPTRQSTMSREGNNEYQKISKRFSGQQMNQSKSLDLSYDTSTRNQLTSSSHNLVNVGADLSLRQMTFSPTKANKTGLSKVLNSSELMNMSRMHVYTPVGKTVCIGDQRQFSGSTNRLLTRPSTEGGGRGRGRNKKIGKNMFVDSNDHEWSTTGINDNGIYTGPRKKPARPYSAYRK